MHYLRSLRYFLAFSIFQFICSPVALAEASASASSHSHAKPAANPIHVDVYKSASCMCCEDWIADLESRGFHTVTHHPADLNEEKSKHGIAPRYQSCHTAVSANGYVFEGHIPAPVIKRFLTEKPKNAIGLAVPGMPVGSPGMEMGKDFNPYDVLLLKADGTSSVYVHISSADQQH